MLCSITFLDAPFVVFYRCSGCIASFGFGWDEPLNRFVEAGHRCRCAQKKISQEIAGRRSLGAKTEAADRTPQSRSNRVVLPRCSKRGLRLDR